MGPVRDGFVGDDLGFRFCERIIHANNYGVDYGSDDAVLRKSLAVVYDGEGYHASLQVKPDFGCVLHEAIADMK